MTDTCKLAAGVVLDLGMDGNEDVRMGCQGRGRSEKHDAAEGEDEAAHSLDPYDGQMTLYSCRIVANPRRGGAELRNEKRGDPTITP
jgi:hypothetical protein